MAKVSKRIRRVTQRWPLLVVAGIPSAMATLFGQRVSKLVAPAMWMPLAPNSRGYTEQYAAWMYERFANCLRNLVLTGRVPNCVLAFVTHEGTEQVLIERFRQEVLVYPFAEASSVTFQVKPTAHVNEHVNKALDMLEECSRIAMRALQAIEKEVRSAANRTPLLLPPLSFSSEMVNDLFERIHENTIKADNPFAAVKHEVERFCKMIPRQSFSHDRKKYFVNDRGIVFRTGAHHGAHNPGFRGDHDVSCFPKSRLRLGASYEPSFHYDCNAVGGRQLPTSWPGCHQQWISVESAKGYVNIYPNDYVR